MRHRDRDRDDGPLVPSALMPALLGLIAGAGAAGGLVALSLRDGGAASPYLTPLAVALHGAAVALAGGLVGELVNWLARGGPHWPNKLAAAAGRRIGLRNSADREREAIRDEAAAHAAALAERWGVYAVLGWAVAILWLVAALTYAANRPEAVAEQRPGGLLLAGLAEGGVVMLGALGLWRLWRGKLRDWTEAAQGRVRDDVAPASADGVGELEVGVVVMADEAPPALGPPPPTRRRYRDLPGTAPERPAAPELGEP